ncbi:hypothetical protein BjapCC829_39585 [Bradyrhizobium barranii]|uniref:Uncharacterized protein n=1 Tax=Bradyrhizobium barranii TaxID=2992140 RepID=A0ABY3QIX7_9BRAD|nr:hypothetical protein [Bradyrhizobium japonicum]UFW85939.1 hypothetical protein BjapCC829_39585 [Bradyrhizobium japonicum]
MSRPGIMFEIRFERRKEVMGGGIEQAQRAVDECDLKRENVDARLGQLGDGSENVIPSTTEVR